MFSTNKRRSSRWFISFKGNGTKIFSNDNPLVLELGCGKGEYSVGLAERYPNKNFVGIDIKGARFGVVLNSCWNRFA
jgi:tRNA G46 methylase TrmB